MNQKQYEEFKSRKEPIPEDAEERYEIKVTIMENKNEWFKLISETIEEGLKNRNTSKSENWRAVIVFFINDEKINEFKKSVYFSKFDGSKLDILTEKNSGQERD